MANVEEKKKEEAPLSRLGRKPVEIPQGVKVSVNGQLIAAEGKRGKLSLSLHHRITAKVEGNNVQLSVRGAIEMMAGTRIRDQHSEDVLCRVAFHQERCELTLQGLAAVRERVDHYFA